MDSLGVVDTASQETTFAFLLTFPMVHQMTVAVMITNVYDDNKKHDSFHSSPVITSPIRAESSMSATTPVEIGKSDDPTPSRFACPSRRTRFIAAAVGVLVMLAVATGIVMATGSKEKPASLSNDIVLDESKTLSAILQRGYLRVGVTSQQGYATLNAKGQYEGFEVDLARAVAAGIFGKEQFQAGRGNEPVHFVPLDPGDRFSSLDDEEIDLLLASTSQTLERTVFEASPRGGTNGSAFIA
jgi:Bacterial extracellular solute-binding proteins, family 3